MPAMAGIGETQRLGQSRPDRRPLRPHCGQRSRGAAERDDAELRTDPGKARAMRIGRPHPATTAPKLVGVATWL